MPEYTDLKPGKTLGMSRTRWGDWLASMIALLICLLTLMTSCGTDDAKTVETVVSVSLEDEANNDNIRVRGDAYDAVPTPVDEPAEGSERVELVRVPEVIGLSMDEALSLLDAEGFEFYPAPRKVSEPGIKDGSVYAVFPAAGTLRPLGSLIVVDVHDSSLVNSTGPDTPVMTVDDWDRARIGMQIGVEFGDRIGQRHWDEPTATFHIQIVDLSPEDIDRLQNRYADESFRVTFSPGTVGWGHLESLNQSTKDLVRTFLPECGVHLPRAIGINVESWSVFVAVSPDDSRGQSVDGCISKIKQAILANAADFAEQYSITADPGDLVQFREEFAISPSPGTPQKIVEPASERAVRRD